MVLLSLQWKLYLITKTRSPFESQSKIPSQILMGMHLSNTDLLQTTRPNKAREFWNTNFVKLVKSKHPYFLKLIEKFKDGKKKAEILLEKTCVEHKRGRPKKK